MSVDLPDESECLGDTPMSIIVGVPSGPYMPCRFSSVGSGVGFFRTHILKLLLNANNRSIITINAIMPMITHTATSVLIAIVIYNHMNK